MGAATSSREAREASVCSAADQAVAASGFAALGDAPDALGALASVYASALADEERRGGGGGGRGGFDPARPSGRSSGGRGGLDEGAKLRVLSEILLAAPILGRGALPPYDGTDDRTADDRRDALEQLEKRWAHDGSLRLLCSEAPAFSFAPLRALDLYR